MPSTDRFDAQDEEYRESVLPAGVVKRMAIEAGVTSGWWKYVGHRGEVIGIDTFGESGPASDVYSHFGITIENVTDTLRSLLTSR